MKKLFAALMLAIAVPAFAAAGEAKPADKSAKKPEEKKAEPAAAGAADAGTAAPAKK